MVLYKGSACVVCYVTTAVGRGKGRRGRVAGYTVRGKGNQQ